MFWLLLSINIVKCVGSILIPLVLAFNTGVEYGGSLISASGLSFLVVRLVTVAFGTQGMGDWELLHFLVLLNNFEFFVIHVGDDVLLLSGQVVIVTTQFTD
jgi:hypothetical protein